MNYYKIDNKQLAKDGVHTFAHWTDGEKTVVSDMDVRRAVGFDLTPEEVQKRYNVTPLTQRQLTAVSNSGEWTMNRKEAAV